MKHLVLSLVVVVVATFVLVSNVQATTFYYEGERIIIATTPDGEPSEIVPALIYPAEINVSGFEGQVGDLDITLIDLSHSWMLDIQMILVSPNGTVVNFLGGVRPNLVDVSDVTLTFDDEQAQGITQNISIPPNSHTHWKPSWNGFSEPFPAPAPPHGFTEVLSAFDGEDPNGIWSLYIVDTFAVDWGILEEWTIDITSIPEPSVVGAMMGVGLLLRRNSR